MTLGPFNEPSPESVEFMSKLPNKADAQFSFQIITETFLHFFLLRLESYIGTVLEKK
jgi:hypothetical protein